MTNMTDLGSKLADLKLFQNVIIDIEQKLMAETGDSTIRERLEKMLESDRSNLSNIESAIAQSVLSADPRDITQQHAEKAKQMISNDQITTYDKFFQLELLKHQQTMTGLVLHKVAQTIGDELQDAMEPLNKVNFENRAHQEVLKGILYFVGTRELAGREPDMGLIGSLEQGMAAIKGAASSLAGAAA